MDVITKTRLESLYSKRDALLEYIDANPSKTGKYDEIDPIYDEIFDLESALTESTLVESSPAYISAGIDSITELENQIKDSDLAKRYVGEHNGGFVFDYGKFYLVLFSEIYRAIGEYTKYNGKPTIILYVLDEYLKQWITKADSDKSAFAKISNTLKQKIQQNIVTLAHEWTHKLDDDRGILLDEKNKTRKPSPGKISSVVDEIAAKHPDIDRKYIEKFITAVNSDVEFNAMITAAIYNAIKSNKTGSFTEFIDGVMNGEQFGKNKTLLTDDMKKKLISRVAQYYNAKY